MAELKTKRNEGDVNAFLEGVDNEKRRTDCELVIDLMSEVTGEKPTMWGGSIIGFGSYHYSYPSGREGDWFVTGVSPRKQSLTLYIMPGFARYGELMGQLGKFKTGKSCLYVKNLEDVDQRILRDLIELSVKHIKAMYP